ncbi:MAG: MarR family transcriptional regulator [bacterium]|nr:MarR family transcriptional regulator [bacterium]
MLLKARYIQYVQNARNVEELAVQRQRFVDDLGAFFAGYGLTATLGRILGHLMLSEEPASLDDIARDLGIAKSGVSTATRRLEIWGMVRRVHIGGSRRVLFEATPTGDAMLSFGLPQVQRFARTLHEGAQVAPPGAPRERIKNLAGAMDLYLEVVQTALERLREEQRS